MVKLKVLCLHGYRQNAAIFRERTGALRKLIKREAEFIFVTAPHVIPEVENLTRSEELQERAWFFSRPEKAYKGTDSTDTCIGLEESISFIENVFKEQGPFDGVLAFSQGACFLSLLSTTTNPFIQYRFLIFISGFKSLLKPHSDKYLTAAVTCPTFHTIGETDTIIPPHMSKDLALLYPHSITYTHSGGHYIPASPELRQNLQDFLQTFLED